MERIKKAAVTHSGPLAICNAPSFLLPFFLSIFCFPTRQRRKYQSGLSDNP